MADSLSQLPVRVVKCQKQLFDSDCAQHVSEEIFFGELNARKTFAGPKTA